MRTTSYPEGSQVDDEGKLLRIVAALIESLVAETRVGEDVEPWATWLAATEAAIGTDALAYARQLDPAAVLRQLDGIARRAGARHRQAIAAVRSKRKR